MERIYIVIDDNNDKILWWLEDQHGASVAQPCEASLDDVAQHCTGREVVVLIGGTAVQVISVSVPDKLKGNHLLKAVPFLLEEQLIERVESLHLCPGETADDRSLAVATLSKNKMDHWIEKLLQANISVNKMYPLMLLVPNVEKSWNIICVSDVCYVRVDRLKTFSVESKNLIPMLKHILKRKEFNVPERFLINGGEGKQEYPLVDNIEISENELNCRGNALLELKITGDEIDLLQGEYKSSNGFKDTKRLFQLGGVLSAACLFVLVIGWWLSVSNLNQQKRVLMTKINQEYRKVYPNAVRISSPKQRMQRDLKVMRDGRSEGDFLELLHSVSRELKRSKGVTLNSASYKDKKISLKVTATSYAQLEKLLAVLGKAGLNVKKNQAETKDSLIAATLVIERGES